MIEKMEPTKPQKRNLVELSGFDSFVVEAYIGNTKLSNQEYIDILGKSDENWVYKAIREKFE